MRRVFIIRKDLHLSSGKLAAMLGHCCEAFWTNLLKRGKISDNEFSVLPCIGTNSNGDTFPEPYLNSEICEKSISAFNSGLSSFIVPKECGDKTFSVEIKVQKDIWNEYVNGIFTKTICECRNLNQLKKAEQLAIENGLVKYEDYGFINDKCLTELKPENEDGTCTVGIWFKPLSDDIAHKISKKFPLYRD